MLDLQPRVHFEEVKPAVSIEQEFHGTGVRVADGRGNRGCGRRHPMSQIRSHHRRRRFLDHFLMTPLDRALALDERQHGAVLVGQHLHFDVPRTCQPAFEIDRRIAERRARLRSRRTNCAGKLASLADDTHALAATTGNGLHHHWIADALSQLARSCRP